MNSPSCRRLQFDKSFALYFFYTVKTEKRFFNREDIMNLNETKSRSLVKSLSWRICATCATISLVYLFTGELIIAMEVGGLEVITKLLLYYLHERFWEKINWGRIQDAVEG